MNRFGLWVAAAVLTSALAGCGGGIEEGPPKDAATANPQPPGFQDMMKKQGELMTNQKKKPAGVTK